MGHTYANLLVHVIFSTKHRQPLITAEVQPRLYEYLVGIARNEFGNALCIGGVADHLHGLLLIKTDESVAHAMNRWKSLSTGWLKDTFATLKDFAWQAGYGAFTVSESVKPQVIHYIQHQAEHHQKRTFQEEFVDFLKRHNVVYDPERIWD